MPISILSRPFNDLKLNIGLFCLFLAAKAKYSGGNRKVYEYYFMKQKCQLQMGTVQCENTVTQLKSSEKYYQITVLSNEVYIFILAQGAQKLKAIKF